MYVFCLGFVFETPHIHDIEVDRCLDTFWLVVLPSRSTPIPSGRLHSFWDMSSPRLYHRLMINWRMHIVIGPHLKFWMVFLHQLACLLMIPRPMVQGMFVKLSQPLDFIVCSLFTILLLWGVYSSMRRMHYNGHPGFLTNAALAAGLVLSVSAIYDRSFLSCTSWHYCSGITMAATVLSCTYYLAWDRSYFGVPVYTYTITFCWTNQTIYSDMAWWFHTSSCSISFNIKLCICCNTTYS